MAAKPSRARAQEEEEDPEGSDVSYDSDEPPQQDQSDADSDEGEASLLSWQFTTLSSAEFALVQTLTRHWHNLSCPQLAYQQFLYIACRFVVSR